MYMNISNISISPYSNVARKQINSAPQICPKSFQASFGSGREYLPPRLNIITPTNTNMQRVLGEKNLEILNDASTVANRLGYNLFVCGGTVRDMLLGKRGKDIDLVIDGDTTKFVQAMHSCNKKLYHKLHIKSRLNRATIYVPNSHIDVSSMRPDATNSTLKDKLLSDAKQRDVTVNAMYIQVTKDIKGKLKLKFIDIVNGKRDLSNRIIRCMSNDVYKDNPVMVFRNLKLQMLYKMKYNSQVQKLEKACLNSPKQKRNLYYYRLVRDCLVAFKASDNGFKFIKEIFTKGYYKLI